MRTVRVYTASKLKHDALWRGIAATMPRIHFTARWPYITGLVPDSPERAEHFWLDDLEDVKRSDVVLVYADAEDKLRGTLVEAGAALALGRIVYVVGEHPDYGTWQWHPKVRRKSNLDAALSEIIAQRASIMMESGLCL